MSQTDRYKENWSKFEKVREREIICTYIYISWLREGETREKETERCECVIILLKMVLTETLMCLIFFYNTNVFNYFSLSYKTYYVTNNIFTSLHIICFIEYKCIVSFLCIISIYFNPLLRKLFY